MLKQKDFLERYNVRKEFEKSDLSWDVLRQIYDDYSARFEELKVYQAELEQYIREGIDAPHHSICSRIKAPEHLIEKIIRKRGKEQNWKYTGINVSNYSEIIHDLIGIRILVLSKEDWEGVHDWITQKFIGLSEHQIFMEESPVAYTRYGDRDIFKGKIYMEHTNRGYRSQHYIVRYKKYCCEIQVRTLAEEVYGEFDHHVKYPYRDENKFLKRYTSSVSQLLDSVDEIISTCFQMGADGWDHCDTYYEKDCYMDWQHTEQQSHRDNLNKKDYSSINGEIDVASYANSVLLRKE